MVAETLVPDQSRIPRGVTRERLCVSTLPVSPLSVISVMEVIQGYRRVGGASRLQAFRDAITSEQVLFFHQAAADLAGQNAGDLDRVERPIGRCDPMIAAIAFTHGLEATPRIINTSNILLAIR